MSKIKNIKKILKSKATTEGAGVHLKRVFGYHQVPLLDPFLLMDDFHSSNPEDYIKGFPWHPHRGIETITYMLHGQVEHGDSLRNKGTIFAGDIQWMTAGSGIIHQEMPLGEEDGLMRGFQLWANLPASHKMMPPRYREIKKEDIPEVKVGSNVQIKVICGTVENIKGPVQDIVTDPIYLDISVPANTNYSYLVKSQYQVFIYVIEGAGYFDERKDSFAYEVDGANYFDYQRDCLIGINNLIIFDEGDEVMVLTQDKPVRFLLISGKPIGEPVAWYGPIVMNTQEELRIAFEEYNNGTFIKG
jgi:redox-sensitive bicupin YhaK (pirin superfamily)